MNKTNQPTNPRKRCGSTGPFVRGRSEEEGVLRWRVKLAQSCSGLFPSLTFTAEMTPGHSRAAENIAGGGFAKTGTD